jgi:heme A synthase
MNYTLYTFQILSVISGAVPVIAAMFNYRQIDKTLKIFTAYLLVSFIFDVGFGLVQSSTLNDMPMVHLYLAISLAFFSVIYYQLFFNSVLKKITLVLSVSTLFMFLYNALKIWAYPSVSNTALSIFLIILSLIYFYQLFNRQEFVYIEKQGLFWINAGILFYSAVNIFFFMLLFQLPKEIRGNVFIIHSSTNIIANLLYTTGLLCKPQKTI